jgi:hypothetical protein
MQFNITLKSIKQSAANLSLFFKESGHNIPKSLIFEGLAKVFFFKNWNTMEGQLTNSLTSGFQPEKRIIVNMEINRDKKYVLQTIEQAAKEVKFKYNILSIHEQNNSYQIEFDTSKIGSNNFITFWFSFEKIIKKDRVTVKNSYYWRVVKEKESLQELFDRK